MPIMSNKNKINCARNNLIDFYLNCFDRRVKRKESSKLLSVGYVLAFIDILIIIKYVLTLFVKFNYQARLYLFDMSIFFGGIPKYISVNLCLTWIIGLIITFKFHMSKDLNFKDILLVFNFINHNHDNFSTSKLVKLLN